MSGHSKWHRIKRKKAAADAKRSQEFTRLSSRIRSAAKAGTDLEKNPALREAITHAQKANMPQANIDHLLRRADDSSLQIQTYEAFGPNGIALLITASTDNSNRTTSELRNLLKKHRGSLGQPGSVMWKFESKAPGKYTTKYPQTPDPHTRQQTAQLVQELNDHPDIDSVHTDIKN